MGIKESTVDAIVQDGVIFVELEAILDVARISAERFKMEGQALAASAMDLFVESISSVFERIFTT